MSEDIYLIYCRNKGKVTVLGPVKQTQDEAETEMQRLRAAGWDAWWVGLNGGARYIVV